MDIELFLSQYDIFGYKKDSKDHLNIINHTDNNLDKLKKKKSKPNIYGKVPTNETKIERAERLSNAYKIVDNQKSRDNDISAEWIVNNIFNLSCIYCGETDWKKLGCDRIDNNLGHITYNCVCACYKCNINRGRREFDKYKKIRIKLL